MEKTYLDKIKQAEEQANDIQRAALHKAEQMLSDAEKENQEYEKQGIEDIENQYRDTILRAEEQAKTLIAKLDEDYAEQCEKLRSFAQPYIQEAVKFIEEKVTMVDGSR